MNSVAEGFSFGVGSVVVVAVVAGCWSGFPGSVVAGSGVSFTAGTSFTGDSEASSDVLDVGSVVLVVGSDLSFFDSTFSPISCGADTDPRTCVASSVVACVSGDDMSLPRSSSDVKMEGARRCTKLIVNLI